MQRKIKKAAPVQNGESVQTDAAPAQPQPPTHMTTGEVSSSPQ